MIKAFSLQYLLRYYSPSIGFEYKRTPPKKKRTSCFITNGTKMLFITNGTNMPNFTFLK